MSEVTTSKDYSEFLKDVVEGRNENDPSGFDHVAETVVTGFEHVGDDVAVTSTCEPYTTSWRPIDPSMVLAMASVEYDASEANKNLRQTAVDVLEEELRRYHNHVSEDYLFDYEFTDSRTETLEFRGHTLQFENTGLMTRVTVMGTAEGLAQFAEEKINTIAPYHGEGSEIKSHASENGRGLVTTEYVELNDKIPIGYLMVDLLEWAYADHAYWANCWVAETDYGAHVVFTIIE